MGESKVVWHEPDDPGMVLSYFLLAMPAAGPSWIVLGHYSTEDDKYSECDTSQEWDKFLQDEGVRLAEKQGLGSGAILMVASEECVLEAREHS